MFKLAGLDQVIYASLGRGDRWELKAGLQGGLYATIMCATAYAANLTAAALCELDDRRHVVMPAIKISDDVWRVDLIP